MRPLLLAMATSVAWTAAAQVHAQAENLGDPSVPPPPEDIELPLPPHLRLSVERLDTWLQIQDERAEGERIESGILSVGLGGVQAGLGLWLMLDEDTFGPVPGRGTIGATSLALGLSALAIGIYQLASTSFAHQRRQRWRLALARGITERELGRFEGELRAEAELARFMRMVEVANGFAYAGAGVATILATALAPLDTLGQLSGYTVGGTLALAGLIAAFASLFSESQAETEWRLYRSGSVPGAPHVDLSLAPTFGSHSGGLELRGSF